MFNLHSLIIRFFAQLKPYYNNDQAYKHTKYYPKLRHEKIVLPNEFEKQMTRQSARIKATKTLRACILQPCPRRWRLKPIGCYVISHFVHALQIFSFVFLLLLSCYLKHTKFV